MCLREKGVVPQAQARMPVPQEFGRTTSGAIEHSGEAAGKGSPLLSRKRKKNHRNAESTESNKNSCAVLCVPPCLCGLFIQRRHGDRFRIVGKTRRNPSFHSLRVPVFSAPHPGLSPVHPFARATGRNTLVTVSIFTYNWAH